MPGRARTALLAAVGSVALLVLVRLAAFHIARLEDADETVLRGFGGLAQHPHVSRLASLIAGLCDPQPYLGLALAPLGIALARRRWWLAVGVGGLLLGANLTTELLKPLLATPRVGRPLPGGLPIAPASWPSGHATASMALALALVLAVPGRWRGWAAVAGAAFSVAVCYSFLTLEWHYPSDVIGGYLVAVSWGLLAVAAVLTIERRHGRRSGASATARMPLWELLMPALSAVGLAAAAALALAVARPHAVVGYLSTHRQFTLGAAAIALLGLVLATSFTALTRR